MKLKKQLFFVNNLKDAGYKIMELSSKNVVIKKGEHGVLVFTPSNQFALPGFLTNNVKLALNLKLDGAYISAYNKNCRFNNYIFHKNFKLIGSAHNLKDLRFKKNQKIEEIFISPIFKKKYNFPLGIHKLNSLFDNFKGKKIALGGINSKNLKLIKLKNFSGFAGIDYFNKKKRAL